MPKLFAAPPAEQNAAPSYLDALLEFSPDVAACLAPGAETQKRQQAAQARVEQFNQLSKLSRDPSTAAQWDKLLNEHEPGFQKLALAQQRSRCVFQTGLSPITLFPHVQASRQVARITAERVRRKVDRGEIESAIQDIVAALRVARELTPRGIVVSQLFAIANEGVCCDKMISTVLAAPGLEPAHCDKLLGVLRQHEEQSIDAYLEGVRTEYILRRILIHDIAHQSGSFSPQSRKQIKLDYGAKDESLAAAVTAAGYMGLMGRNPTAADYQTVELLLAKFDEKAEIAAIDEAYQSDIANGALPYAQRNQAFKAAWPTPLQRRVLVALLFVSVNGAFRNSVTRNLTQRHGAQAVVAVRRWQLTQKTTPTDLAQVMAAAGVNTVPRDEYSAAPLRLATVNGKAIVYSIGPDGNDDGGRIEWNFHPDQPGDYVFHVSPRP